MKDRPGSTSGRDTATGAEAAMLRAIVDRLPAIVWATSVEGRTTYVSPHVERLLGTPPATWLHDPEGRERQIHPDDRERVRAARAQAQAHGAPYRCEYRFLRADGGVVWLLEEGVAVHDGDGRPLGLQGVSLDITERRQAEETQERLRQHLRHSEKLTAMGELLAGVAHELNNPLSVVIGHTAILARATDPVVVGRAEKIGRAAERCGRIVKNFLALARQYPPERTSVSLNQIVRDALETLAYPLRVDDVEVTTQLAEDLPLLSADGHQLQQVVANLVTNAHQAMRSRNDARRLTLRSGTGPAGTVWLEVSDSGPGIPPEVQARLFEPFFTTKPIGQGTGLGLSICKGIVEGHGGRIRLDGSSGRGATFRIELPIGGPVTTPPLPDEGPIGPHRRILVVDDEVEVGYVMSELLRRDGHEVDTAVNGLEALARLRARSYDAIVSDIKMPQLDGVGLWTTVKRDDPALAARFVFFTGDTLSSATSDFLERTGAPNLKKPFALRDVRIALSRVPSR